ncbi:hypothetical protein [Sinomonas sp. G460-2]|uniref:hypothetical protein n=1 Tax=Sinomonas sp. G460-2 TaxID=3393464 RepID=UPI0039EFA5DD
MAGLALVADARHLGASRGTGAAALWRMSSVARRRALFARPSSREMLNVIGLLPQACFLCPTTDETGWWKIDAVLEFVATSGIDRVVWLDGELQLFDPRLGVTYREAAEDALADAGISALLMAPDPARGLNSAAAQLVEDFGTGRLWAPVWSVGAPPLETAV